MNKQTQEWISVKDRLPSEGNYLAFLNNGFVCMAFFTKENNWCEMWGTKTLDVTHWMPLPEIPQGTQ